MSLCISASSWLTPLGADPREVLQAIQEGRMAPPGVCREGERSHACRLVPDELLERAAGMPRLRRSGRISQLAVEAALRVVECAGPDFTPERTALVMAACDGGVGHTRKFYSGVLAAGPGAGSPLLFPETVYNAPTSHIAAALGLTGECLTIVSDATGALAALDAAEAMLASGEYDQCLIVAAEEVEWVTLEGYGAWGWVASEGRPGAVFAEGAAAVLTARHGGRWRCATRLGPESRTLHGMRENLDGLLSGMPGACDGGGPAVLSAAGNRLEEVERSALGRACPSRPVIEPKSVLGESLCAAALMQVIAAGHLMEESGVGDALVTVFGYQGLCAASHLTPCGA